MKEKHIIVDEEIHKQAKLQATQAGLSMKEYIRLCLAQCKSDKKV